ncbi:MAG TPA: hypothetical protein VGP82_12070 [Ktedonobacterales bacterium]|nr:hypothetical protein [Ktedonobacterales bacterium]
MPLVNAVSRFLPRNSNAGHGVHPFDALDSLRRTMESPRPYGELTLLVSGVVSLRRRGIADVVCLLTQIPYGRLPTITLNCFTTLDFQIV